MGKSKMNNLQCLITIIASLFSAISFGITFSDTSIYREISGNGFIVTILFIIFLKLGQWFGNNKMEILNIRGVFFCLFIAFLWLLTEGFRLDNSLDPLFSSFRQGVKSFVYIIGRANILILFFQLEESTLNNKERIKCDPYNKYSFWIYFSLILFGWMPHIIISYPGYTTSGYWWSLSYFYGIDKFSAHVPPVHTIVIGALMEFGSILGNSNVGLFLCVLLQVIIFALILSYIFQTMKFMKTPLWLIKTTYIVSILAPYYTHYVVTVLRDNPYSYGVMLLSIELIYFFILKEKFWKSRKHLLLFDIAISMIIFFRKNGIYLAVLMFFVLLVYFFIRRKKEFQTRLIRKFILLLFPIVLSIFISVLINICFDVEAGSIREALSLPFQQTARYINKYGNEVTEEEKKAISKILDYETIEESYNPLLSDPVKDTFNEETTRNDLKDYFIVWIKQFIKHPFVYIEATLNQNYLLWYPFENNEMLYINVFDGSTEETKQLVDIHVISNLEKLQNLVKEFDYLMFFMPVIGLLSNLGFYNLVLFFILVFSVYKKYCIWLLASLPVWISNIIIIFAPCIKNHSRYGLPIIYSAPILIAFYIYLNEEKVKISNNSLECGFDIFNEK